MKTHPRRSATKANRTDPQMGALLSTEADKAKAQRKADQRPRCGAQRAKRTDAAIDRSRPLTRKPQGGNRGRQKKSGYTTPCMNTQRETRRHDMPSISRHAQQLQEREPEESDSESDEDEGPSTSSDEEMSNNGEAGSTQSAPLREAPKRSREDAV